VCVCGRAGLHMHVVHAYVPACLEIADLQTLKVLHPDML